MHDDYRIAGGYMEAEDGAWQLLTLLRGDNTAVRCVRTQSLAVYAAAGALLEQSPDPETLVMSWPEVLIESGGMVDEIARWQARRPGN